MDKPRGDRQPGTPSQTEPARRSALRSGYRRVPGSAKLGALLYAAKTPLFALPLYNWTLAGDTPPAPRLTVSDPWPGNADIGTAVVDGRIPLAGRMLGPVAPPWPTTTMDPATAKSLHGFEWLRDLRALGGDAARRRAREAAASWIESHNEWQPLSWHPEVVGRRLVSWFGHYEFFAASAEEDFRQSILESAARQARHLARVLPAGLCGNALVSAITGLVCAGVVLRDGDPWWQRGLALLRPELQRQILIDGGHIERCPATHLQVLRDLIDMRALLAAAGIAPPSDLQLAIERMAAVLRTLRHGDGGLALFNGGSEADACMIDMVTQRASPRSATLKSMPQSGFHRLEAGRALVLVDAGGAPPAGFDGRAHAGTLSFEMSVGRERLIVNCGSFRGHRRLSAVTRSTAAHSTLTLASTNSSPVLPQGGLGRRPGTVASRRQESEEGLWLDMSHDGYRPAFDMVHHRRLYLAARGDDLRGEDRLEGPAHADRDFAVRFHLHPEVHADLAADGQSALLRMPSEGSWLLRARGGELALEDSIYLGDQNHPRRCRQVVVSGRSERGQAIVKWAIRRAPRPDS